MFDGGTCPANAEALADVTLLALPREALLRVVEQHPALALALLKEFTGRLRHLVNLVDELALHTVQGRLAGMLLAQAEAAERGEVGAAADPGRDGRTPGNRPRDGWADAQELRGASA